MFSTPAQTEWVLFMLSRQCWHLKNNKHQQAGWTHLECLKILYWRLDYGYYAYLVTCKQIFNENFSLMETLVNGSVLGPDEKPTKVNLLRLFLYISALLRYSLWWWTWLTADLEGLLWANLDVCQIQYVCCFWPVQVVAHVIEAI